MAWLPSKKSGEWVHLMPYSICPNIVKAAKLLHPRYCEKVKFLRSSLLTQNLFPSSTSDSIHFVSTQHWEQLEIASADKVVLTVPTRLLKFIRLLKHESEEQKLFLLSLWSHLIKQWKWKAWKSWSFSGALQVSTASVVYTSS